MKYLFLIFILSFSGGLFAQNYQTVKSNQIHFFGTTDTSYVLATRTDSVLMSGSDSVFYSFSTLRPYESCAYKGGAPWYGKNVIIKQNGDNCFFNKDLDTITIKTQAALNDTFLVYTYPNGNCVKGWVSSIYLDSYLGVVDSIKDISLFSNDSTFFYQGLRLRIGKELGFVSVVPFYAFPNEYYVNSRLDADMSGSMQLIGSENTHSGITRRTVGEIFDFNQGDAVQWSEYTMSTWSYITNDYYRSWEILNRTDYGQDSIELLVNRSTKSNHYDGNYVPPVNTTNQNTSQITRKYYNLDSLFFKTLPEESYIEILGSDYAVVLQSWMNIDHCGKVCEGFIDDGIGIILDSQGSPDSSNCATQLFIEPEYWIKEYVEGSGGPYVIWGGSFLSYYTTHYGGYISWKSGSNQCGYFSFIGLDQETESQIHIYPNPSNGFVTIELDQIGSGELAIYDLSGKLVLREVMFNKKQQLDLSFLESGTYLIKIKTDLGSRTEKLIIR